MPGAEQFNFNHNLASESAQGRGEGFGSKVSGRIRGTIGELKVDAEFDPERLQASAHAKATTVRVEAEGDVESPVGDAHGNVHAEGPSAHADARASTEGVEGTLGASAGEIGAHGDVEIAGQDFGFGADAGLKAELGLKWGSTSRVDLPFVSLEGPNPYAGAAQFAAEAVKNLADDPVGTMEDAANDVIGFGEQRVDDVGDVISDVGDAISDVGDVPFGNDSNDDHVVTTDEAQGPRPQLKPGQHYID